MGFNAEGGSRDHRHETRASHSSLHRFVRPVRAPLKPKDGYFLRAESFFTTATFLEAAGATRAGQQGLHEQSHGESFFNLFENRFGGDGLYILDEPEAALSPSRQLSFLARLHDLVLERSQFIIATHSPIILAYPDAWDLPDLGSRAGAGRVRGHRALPGHPRLPEPARDLSGRVDGGPVAGRGQDFSVQRALASSLVTLRWT